MDPTLDVELNPVNPIPISVGDIDPTPEVVLTPVITGVESITKPKEPTLDVALTPVGDITDVKSKVKEPTLEVAESPDG